MLDKIKYSTISNIYIKDLKFYDDTKEAELKKMCLDYGITYLPNQDRKSCYKLTGECFAEQNLKEDLICNPYDRLFDEKTLAKFESGNHDEVMFVVEENIIKGVVHIVDYNADFINYEFFKATYQFEKHLRSLLIIKGETNDSLIDWMKHSSEINDHWKRRYNHCMPKKDFERNNQIKKRIDCSPFQTFYMNDLLSFIKHKKFLSDDFNYSIESIKEIRNWVAHNKDLAHKTELANFPLYNIDELKTFVKHANQFFKAYEELEEGLLLLLNKSK